MSYLPHRLHRSQLRDAKGHLTEIWQRFDHHHLPIHLYYPNVEIKRISTTSITAFDCFSAGNKFSWSLTSYRRKSGYAAWQLDNARYISSSTTTASNLLTFSVPIVNFNYSIAYTITIFVYKWRYLPLISTPWGTIELKFIYSRLKFDDIVGTFVT